MDRPGKIPSSFNDKAVELFTQYMNGTFGQSKEDSTERRTEILLTIQILTHFHLADQLDEISLGIENLAAEIHEMSEQNTSFLDEIQTLIKNAIGDM